ncbi:hypothetical protein H072_2743 [Dactylellina haptotyla CBS 200.50]|uniref:Uncharacterized protein n=1 Tax=Dactylellina haptotyla (strain CBS 200.50) TaxID=1284197 RepID=S8AJY9_DACHA|nr:hypothetical protein H072_2743 [Dactylellina haptotyla CBS 200.50]
MMDVDNVEPANEKYISEEYELGPFELSSDPCTNNLTSAIKLHSRSTSSSDDSYDHLSDTSPRFSPAEPHSSRWRDVDSMTDEHEQPDYGEFFRDNIFAEAAKLRLFDIDSSYWPRPATFPGSLPTDYTKKSFFADELRSTETALMRNSFSSPSIQEKMRQQSVLYHQIHEMLAQDPDTRRKSIFEASKENQNEKQPHTPIFEPKFKIEGVDHAKIKALKEKYPDKMALHKHLDTYSSVMARFVAVCSPEVSILDMKPIDVGEDEKIEKVKKPKRFHARGTQKYLDIKVLGNRIVLFLSDVRTMSNGEKP